MNFNINDKIQELKRKEETEKDLGKRQGYEDIKRADWFPWTDSTESLIAILDNAKDGYKDRIEKFEEETIKDRYKGRIEAVEEYQEYLRKELQLHDTTI